MILRCAVGARKTSLHTVSRVLIVKVPLNFEIAVNIAKKGVLQVFGQFVEMVNIRRVSHGESPPF
nr:MAG TPA: hypothetical protein [Caudoviricetes sp.]